MVIISLLFDTTHPTPMTFILGKTCDDGSSSSSFRDGSRPPSQEFEKLEQTEKTLMEKNNVPILNNNPLKNIPCEGM